MATDSMSRAEAKAQGLKRYFGNPCKYGHSGERFIDGTCVECRLEKNRQWAKRNPEKVKENNRRWADENSERKKAYQREYHRGWYQLNQVAKNAQSKQYLKDNPDKNRAAALRWRGKNLEKARETATRWYKDNPEKRRLLGKQKRERKPDVYKAHFHNRRARKIAAGGTHTADDLADILRMQRYLCAHPGCGADLRKVGKHLDHIMPLALGGSNDRRNLQFLCAPHNLSKGAKDPIAFAQEIGRLL